MQRVPPVKLWGAARDAVGDAVGAGGARVASDADSAGGARVASDAGGAGNEFPEGASVWDEGLDRRAFLRLSSAALGLVGLSACNGKRLAEKIVPYVRQPDALASGESVPFATSHVTEGLATGLVIRSFEGRPVKAEGNPEHPASLGGTSIWNQAYCAELFSPARAVAVKRNGSLSTWGEFDSWLAHLRETHSRNGGGGLVLLTEASSSPSFAASVGALREAWPNARWVQYEPLRSTAEEEGCELAFGRRLEAIYDFSAAGAVVSFECDFLHRANAPLRYARQFAARRRGDNGARLALWAVEASPTLTGANADIRYPLPPRDLEACARAFFTGAARETVPERARPALDSLRDFSRRENTLFLAGESQPAWLHAFCHARNARARAPAVRFIEPVRAAGGPSELRELAASMRAGSVSSLFCLGGNPAYSAPADSGFAQALTRVPNRVKLGLEDDETAALCEWSLPMSHALESWGDSLAFDGTISFLQPLIDPLYASRAPSELLSALAGEKALSEELVKKHWRREWGSAFSRRWEEALARGFDQGTSRSSVRVVPRAISLPPGPGLPAEPAGSFELTFRADHALLDGRHYASPWLQELPRPLTELAWGNAVLLSPKDARRLRMETGQLVRVESGSRAIEAPAFVLPGQAEGCATLTFGYGRKLAHETTPFGYDAYKLWTGASAVGTVGRLGGEVELATMQLHGQLDPSHDPVRFFDPARAGGEARARPVSLYGANPEPESPYAWGMVIDLSRCIGCKACVIACQAENNIPTVGREGVLRGRAMHWIRVDGYYEGDEHSPATHFQPVPCMHCEKAPCEPVCPVAATVHNDEGLNQMIYNRCVGTRYCSNNCPYKVRRFNFFEYNQRSSEPERLLKNPDVSVRPRGVMEKCTYCVQRISRARITAEREGRLIGDGEVITACQAACPANAIEFGNLKDPASRVSAWKLKHGHYGLLEELGTRPRTSYLAKAKEGA